jgi:hypothetical protein
MTLQDNKLDPDARPMPSRQLTELLGRALLDQELRERLLADPEAIGREFDLAPTEVKAIKLLRLSASGRPAGASCISADRPTRIASTSPLAEVERCCGLP